MTNKRAEFVDDEPIDLIALTRELYCKDIEIEQAETDKKDALARIEDDLEDAKQRLKKAKDDRKKIVARLSKAGQFSGSEIKPIRKAS